MSRSLPTPLNHRLELGWCMSSNVFGTYYCIWCYSSLADTHIVYSVYFQWILFSICKGCITNMDNPNIIENTFWQHAPCVAVTWLANWCSRFKYSVPWRKHFITNSLPFTNFGVPFNLTVFYKMCLVFSIHDFSLCDGDDLTFPSTCYIDIP